MNIRQMLHTFLVALLAVAPATASSGGFAIDNGEEQIPGVFIRPVPKIDGPVGQLDRNVNGRVQVLPVSEGRDRSDGLVVQSTSAPGSVLVVWAVLDDTIVVPLGRHVLDEAGEFTLPAPPEALRDRVRLVIVDMAIVAAG